MINNPVEESVPQYWFNNRTIGKSPEVADFVDDLYFDSINPSGRGYHIDQKLLALNNVLTNLQFARMSGDWLYFSRNANHFTIPARYGLGHYKYKNVIPIVDALQQAGLIYQQKGYYDRRQDLKVPSRMTITNKLVDSLSPIRKWNPHNLAFKDPLLFKNEKKRLMASGDALSPKARRARLALNTYNEFIERTQVRFCLYVPPEGEGSITPLSYFEGRAGRPPLVGGSPFITYIISGKDCISPYLDCRLYRVFNYGSIAKGGRFYGPHYQQLDEEYRRHLLISGNPVVELDYSGFHFRMLYHEQGIDYQDDPYQVIADCEAERELLKLIAIVAMNTESRRATIGAVLYSQDKDIQQYIRRSQYTVPRLVSKLEQVHHPVADKLYKKYALTLQNKDSWIADDVLQHFTNRNIPCLCVHDSFIVERQHEDELRSVMKEVYREHMNGFDPVIKN